MSRKNSKKLISIITDTNEEEEFENSVKLLEALMKQDRERDGKILKSAEEIWNELLKQIEFCSQKIYVPNVTYTKKSKAK